MFQYKTRGNASPQGKQRVYFTCHPEDFERVFERISDDVLKVVNCAVWYDTSEKGNGGEQENTGTANDAWKPYEDIETDLGQMQLFVIPVTARLLSGKNRTMEVDVPFALSHHIPILPLMQEAGLDSAYSRKFGELQYLDKYAQDDTALSYQEKFERFLKAVLIGDKELEKIRQAFDAYIFMSYRKKDRKYANELMRLIHQNDFCRDLAIWYDEYLTPGENFNKAIEEALKKSELFTLVVTPNLVNEKNYVQSTEYPMAQEAGKKVLPAEMEKTDEEELKKQFAGIPMSVDARDESGLSDELRKQLMGIAKHENDDDPAHNYLIGLAYLNGIDVEKNNERAIRLITMAAEKGCLEAMEKLVDIYENGAGTNISYKRAIEWGMKAASKMEELWTEDKQREDIVKRLIDRYEKLYLLSIKIKQYDEAQKVMEKSIGFIRSLEFDEKDSGMENRLAHAFLYLALLYQVKREYADAEKCYQESLKIQERLILVNPGRHKGDLAQNYMGIAQLYRSKKQFEKAEEYFRKALAIQESLAENDLETQGDALARYYYGFAGMYQDVKNHGEAEKLYLKAIEVLEKLKALNPKVGDAHLARTYCGLSKVYIRQKKYAESLEYYQKALYIRERLSRKNPEVYEKELASNYFAIGNVFITLKQYVEAEEFHMKALRLRENLPAGFENRKGLSLISSYHSLARLYLEWKQYDKAELYGKKSVEIRETVNKLNHGVFDKEVATGYHCLARIYHEQNRFVDAETYYLKAIEIRERLNGTNPKVFGSDLESDYEKLADLYHAFGKLDEAEEYGKKAIEIREMLK